MRLSTGAQANEPPAFPKCAKSLRSGGRKDGNSARMRAEARGKAVRGEASVGRSQPVRRAKRSPGAEAGALRRQGREGQPAEGWVREEGGVSSGGVPLGGGTGRGRRHEGRASSCGGPCAEVEGLP